MSNKKKQNSKAKRFFEAVRQRPQIERYCVMAGVNIIFYGLLSILSYLPMSSDMVRLTGVGVSLALFCFSVVYGFLSAEITDGMFAGNIMFALFGGIYGAFIGNAFLEITVLSGFLAYIDCTWYFLKYCVSAFLVSLIIKNTR